MDPQSTQPMSTPPPSPPPNETDKILNDLQLNLPGKNLPMGPRVIVFFTLIGGLSIFGSLFADIVRPNSEDLAFYFVRILVGVGAVTTSYALIEKRRWGIWLYGLIAFFALFSNPFISAIPWIVVIYLITQRQLFTPSWPDFLLAGAVDKIKTLIRKQQP